MALCVPAFDGDDQMRSAWSTFLARNTDTPIEFDLATRIPICFVTATTAPARGTAWCGTSCCTPWTW